MHDNLKDPARRKTGDVAAPARSVSVIMPTVSWTGTFERCARRVLGELDAEAGSAELVVVLDGEHALPPEWLVRDDVRIVSTGSRSGPAVARNLAAKAARAEVLFFVDADVELADGSIELVRERFRMDAGLVALFGSYDDEPASARPVSHFRNLLHHHTHVSHPGRAVTFWSGCGAIRAKRFRAANGFDGRYRFPSVEDIELGSRLTARGDRIELEPALQCKHHKDWTVRSMIHTDIVHRAVPWTRMMMRTRKIPSTLAVDWRNRACGILTVTAFASVVPAILFPWAWTVTVACLAAVFFLNLRFYRLCRRKRGVGFAGAAFGLHLLFFTYASITFAAVVLHGWFGRSAAPAERPAAGRIGNRAPLPVPERS
jgi:GT2 family glycosyltransferase